MPVVLVVGNLTEKFDISVAPMIFICGTDNIGFRRTILTTYQLSVPTNSSMV